MAKGFLVSKEWVRGVEEALRTLGASQLEKKQPVGGLFYDIRPAVLASSWTQNAAGLYVATAQFIVNDNPDSSFTFDVCAPASDSNPGGTVGTTRFYVVWRGRWELVAGAGGMTAQEIKELLETDAATQRVISDFSLSLLSGGYLALNLDTANIKYYKAP